MANTTTPSLAIKAITTKGLMLLLLASCAKQQPTLQPLWETPPLPQGVVFLVDGTPVDEDVLNNFLTRPWSTLCAEQEFGLSVAQLEDMFFAEDGVVELLQPLVRTELLSREAADQFGEINDNELDNFQREMEANVGAALEDSTNRYGVDGRRAHALRQLQMRKLHEVFREYSVVITDKEVHDYYSNHVMADLPSAIEREQQSLSYESLAPMLREKLEKDAITAAEEKWIDEHLPETSAVLKLRDGQEVIIY
jgi:hypothetical protein